VNYSIIIFYLSACRRLQLAGRMNQRQNADVQGGHEVTSVCNEIDEHAGPRSVVIVAIVAPDSQHEIRRHCTNAAYSPGMQQLSLFLFELLLASMSYM
jgi:hypothetical protein